MKPPAPPPGADGASAPPPHQPPPRGLVGRAALASFLVMGSYYVLRPVRDELASEYRDLTATWWTWVAFIAIAVMPLYSAFVSRRQKAGLTRRVYRVMVFALLGFAGASFQQDSGGQGFTRGLASTYYVFASLYPMFVVSVLWSTLSECFDSAAGKRSIGPIFAAGTVGAAGGSIATALVSSNWISLRFEWLLIYAAALLLAASFAVPRGRASAGGAAHEVATPGAGRDGSQGSQAMTDAAHDRVSARLSTGLGKLMRSPYLLGIAAYLFLFTFGSGFLYFFQRDLIYEAFPDRDDRRFVLAALDWTVQIMTVVGQGLIAGPLLRRLGTGAVLLIVPSLTLLGFAALALMPVFAAFAVFQVARRTSNYAFAKPARELLYTVVGSEERYLTKPFLDVGVYRFGDVISAQSYEAIQEALDAKLATMAWVAVPFAALWLPVAKRLGDAQERRAAEQA